MPNGGKLTIETANKWLDDRAARERNLPPGQYVSLCVTDNGTGMQDGTKAAMHFPFANSGRLSLLSADGAGF